MPEEAMQAQADAKKQEKARKKEEKKKKKQEKKAGKISGCGRGYSAYLGRHVGFGRK